MDPTALAAPTGILGWVSTYGNVVYFFAQIAYWFCLIVLLGYAVAQFKRWVNYQLGTGKSGKLRTEAAEKPAAETKVSVEEFVE